MTEKRYENALTILRFFAICSVVCAHGTGVPEDFSQSSIYASYILLSLGTIGVGLFFFISGRLFLANKTYDQKFIPFLKNKIIKLVIPWFFASFLIWIYVSIRKGWNVLDLLLSTLGYGSSFWYMSVLFVLLLMFYFLLKFKNKILVLIISIIISLAFLILRGVGIIPNGNYWVYLNPFNWSIFFCVGALSTYIKTETFNADSKYIPLVLSSILFVFSSVVVVFVSGDKISYFKWYYFLFELVSIIVFYCFSLFLSKFNATPLEFVGKKSFSIYLFSELVWAGLFAYLFNKYDNVILVLIRPICVLTCTLLELILGFVLFKLIKCEKVFTLLTGFKLELERKK